MLSVPARRSHPLWSCALRPFFLASVVAAPLFILLWIAFLGAGFPLPALPGGPLVWHAHELIFGFALAAVAGFALTAVPEFTDTADYGPGALRGLALLWLIGRIAFWTSGLFGTPALLLSGVAHLGLVSGLIVLIAPRLWADPERRHLAFAWALLAILACIAGFYYDALTGAYPSRWLYAALGVLMMLIVVAMSRISMRLVNSALEEAGIMDVAYRARLPRRNLAIFCIALYTLAEFFLPFTRLSGWLALAAAAALLNLLNDWHLGRVLLRRWVLMLYGVYVLMAAGYALMGHSLIAEGEAFSAGRHLLAVGAMGLNIYVVIAIAGRVHAGHRLDERLWVPVGAALLVLAAVLRAATAWSADHAAMLLTLSGLLWVVAFGLSLFFLAPAWLAPRTDGGRGCDGPR